jgi:hypothetical protein
MRYIYIKEDSFLKEKGIMIGESYEGKDKGERGILILWPDEEGKTYCIPCRKSHFILDPEENIL